MRYPRDMTLELTAKCNFSCPYCYCVWHEYPALSGAKAIQVGPMMLGGRAMFHPELMLSRDEWKSVKARIRALPDARVPYTFCEEFICACRPDTSRQLLDEWGDKNRKPCPAGKSFGVVGPDGLYRSCLHTLPPSPPGFD